MEISSFNKKEFLTQIKDKIRNYYESFGISPSILLISPDYLIMLKQSCSETVGLNVGDMQTFEGLKIIKTMRTVCEVY